jgi:hypothetical protein
MEWIEIRTQSDADTLMEAFGSFHDSCIREARLWTDHWVSPDLSMSCSVQLDHRIQFLIQRQFKDLAAIELFFDHVTRFNLVPSPENYDSVIFAATLLVQNGNIFWSPEDDWRPEKPDKDIVTWVSAKKLQWREVDWLGRELRYGPKETSKGSA